MRTLLAAFIAAFFVTAAWADPAPVKKHEEMLYTVTMIEAGTSRGSGTVIYSAEREGWETYILTNFHVVDSAIEIVEEWDSDEGKEVKKETRDPVTVNWFRYNDYSRNVGTTGREATIEAYDRTADLALLKLVDAESGAEWVAALFPESETVHLFDETFAVGAGMGKPPFATNGLIAYLDARIDGHRYMMSTAPIIYGNSGGALFRYSVDRDRYELVGVPSRGTVAGYSIVEHMNWSIVIDTIRAFLRESGHGFIAGDEEPKE